MVKLTKTLSQTLWFQGLNIINFKKEKLLQS